MGWAHCWPSAHSPRVCTSISTTNPWDWEVIERMEALDGGSWVPTPAHPAVTAGAEPSAPQRAVGHSEQNPPAKINKSKAKAQHLPRGVGGGRGGGAGRAPQKAPTATTTLAAPSIPPSPALITFSIQICCYLIRRGCASMCGGYF